MLTNPYLTLTKAQTSDIIGRQALVGGTKVEISISLAKFVFASPDTVDLYNQLQTIFSLFKIK